MTRVRAEEDRVYRKRYAQFSQLGVGVTAAAQTIFDSLAKTLPCRWDRDNIIILDTVRLSPPYDVESIRYVHHVHQSHAFVFSVLFLLVPID